MLPLLFFLVQRRGPTQADLPEVSFPAVSAPAQSFERKRRRMGPDIPSCPEITPPEITSPEITSPSITSSGASPLPNCTSLIHPVAGIRHDTSLQIAYVKLVVAGAEPVFATRNLDLASTSVSASLMESTPANFAATMPLWNQCSSRFIGHRATSDAPLSHCRQKASYAFQTARGNR